MSSWDGKPRRSAGRAALLAVCGLLVSCRLSPTGTLIGPSLGAEPWAIATSEHFTVRADVGETETREIAVDMERSYRLLSELGFPLDKEPNLHTDVIVFRTKEEYLRVGPKNTAGFFRAVGFDSLDGGTFMTYGGLSDAARRNFLHELTHRFVHHVCPQAPIWLNEGLADYYETMTVEGGKAVLGRSPYVFKRGDSWKFGPGGVPVGVLPSWSELTGMDAKTFYAARTAAEDEEGAEARDRQHANYASAWATVHLLQNHREHYGDRLHQWLVKMAAGTPADEAYRQAFGDMSMDLLEKDRAELLESLVQRESTVLRTDYDASRPAAVEARALTRPEEDLVRARLDLMTPGGEIGAARAHVDAALKRNPGLTEAHLLSAQLYMADGDATDAEQELTDAANLDPKNEIVAYEQFRFYARPLKGMKRSPERIAKAVAILTRWAPIAKSPTVLNDFAWFMVVNGRAEEAVPIVKRSIERDPSCPECFDTLGAALFRTGEYKAAIGAQEMSVALEREDSFGGELAERLELFKKAWSAIVIWKKHPAPDQDPAMLPKAVIGAVERAQKPHLWACYVPGRARSPKLAGAVVVAAEIGADGKVSGAESVPAERWDSLPDKPAVAALPDDEVSRCVAAQIRATRFPASSGPTKVIFPISFAPNKSVKIEEPSVVSSK